MALAIKQPHAGKTDVKSPHGNDDMHEGAQQDCCVTAGKTCLFTHFQNAAVAVTCCQHLVPPALPF